jgi:flavin reductase (DIM6/NTAB) family NADH-FMN oxidoreductase RutF
VYRDTDYSDYYGALRRPYLCEGEQLMVKIQMGPQTMIYPMPVLLVGAKVNDKPNFMTVAWGGIANGEPPMVSVALRHQRYTLRGIRQTMTFSVNVPSSEMVREADYCGTISGSKVDKVKVCEFKVFYGKLSNAPLIEQCPVNLECKVVHLLDLGSHSLVIGRIEETHVSEICLTNGQPDVNKIKPLIYARDPARQYLEFGRVIAKAYSIGQELKGKE